MKQMKQPKEMFGESFLWTAYLRRNNKVDN